MQKTQLFFTETLALWHLKTNVRKLPWKHIKDAYKIWLSEVLLQQTKAEQALPYYEAFIAAFPTIHDLANAPTEDVYKLWQGLGYYNRCNNLLHTAKYISADLNGKFPKEYTQIIALKGVGPYTASAIASFAFGLPHAVVDGNVYRVLSRFFGIEKGFFTAADKNFYTELAQQLLPVKKSASHNQAIMDFGATVCKPALPLCATCSFAKKCIAFTTKKTQILPFKKPKIKITERHFHYLVIAEADGFYVRKRTEKDIWQNLHEFYMLESANTYIPVDSVVLKQLQSPVTLFQKLTHQHIYSYFYAVKKWPKILHGKANYQLINKTALQTLAMPKSIAKYIQENILA